MEMPYILSEAQFRPDVTKMSQLGVFSPAPAWTQWEKQQISTQVRIASLFFKGYP